MIINFKQTILSITPLFLLISAENSVDPETQKNRIECVEKCGGGNYLKSVISKNELLCVSNWLGYKIETHTPCFLECMGMKPDEDQQKCWVDYCKEDKNAVYFCSSKSDYDYPISQKKCDLLSSGEVKFSHRCKFNSNTHFGERIKQGRASVKDCIGKCGGEEHDNEMWANLHALCFAEGGNAATPCVFDCMGWKPNPNQQMCWASYCQGFPEGASKFCREPKGNYIQRSECNLVSSGEVKPYGNCT